MKALNLKLFTTAMAITSMMSTTTIVRADEVVIPVISKPAVLQEGTQRDLTPAQVAELLPWAKNSKMFLTDLLDSLQNISSADKVDRMVQGIKQVVGESSPKNTELLMRYTLNRALVLNDVLTKEMNVDAVGTIDAKIRVLTSSINLAIKYYDQDMDTLQKKAPMQFIAYGTDYFGFLYELNKSIFDASAQYNVHRIALEWLQWDLYRDLNNTSHAASIVKINNNLKLLPTKSISDAQAITYIRQMKQLTAGMSFSPLRNGNGTISNSSSSRDILKTTNFNKCYVYAYESLSADEAVDYCTKVIRQTNFDFTKAQFQICHSIANHSLSSIESVKKCIEDTQQGFFDYDSKNFKQCYSQAYESLSSVEAMDFCKKTIEETSFNFLDDGYLQCHELVNQSLSSITSVKKCMNF